MKSNIKNKKRPKQRYELGSFVNQNSEVSQQYQSNIANLAKPQGGNMGKGTVTGLSTGASIGGSIMPGIGTAIGAVIGGLGGAIFGSSADQREKKRYNEEVEKLNTQRSNITKDLYESSIDTYNENPYGIYADGGDILDPIINIEKGELQIDPDTGKILREYNGINPETGGAYEAHNKKGKDTNHNMVTAKEGSFIITKKDAKKYKTALDNNDEYYKNAIISNIRNKKKEQSNKFADGGFIDPNILPNLNQVRNVNMTGKFNVPNSINKMPYVNSNMNINPGINWGGVASSASNYIPSLVNMFQGSRRANTLPYVPARMNVENRQRILNNLPQDISVNPALNNIRGARNRAYRGINSGTSNPSIARANKLAMEDSFLSAENEALFNNQLMNNQVRGQRANILSGLDAQDNARTMQNVSMMNDTFLTNRRMQQAKTDQFNYGLSQAQQMFQNNRTNRSKQDMQNRELEILRQVFPVLGQYYPNLTGGR